ncbi:MAG: DNA-processing protein DprA [Candidatus Paceibacterota bacterium]
MTFQSRELKPKDFPPQLREIPDPPKSLHLLGHLPGADYVYLTVVGSRRASSYGQEICRQLIGALTGRPVAIISGLALGIDAIAHRAALASSLPTIAVPGSGLDRRVLYPRTNIGLADDIMKAGGALLSEFEPLTPAAPYTFPQRNRIMAGLAQAVLVIEAAERSGTLITARLALDYNRDVLAVPGSILAGQSFGPHRLIRDGATPITGPDELLLALGFDCQPTNGKWLDLVDGKEEIICRLLADSPLSRDSLIEQSSLPAAELNTLLSILEVKGLIKEIGGQFTFLR